jgi:hypothetical protein
LDFNLKAHMKTHSADNYHVCQYPECGRRFTQESKLRAHIRAQHEKVRSLIICEFLLVKEKYSNKDYYRLLAYIIQVRRQ